MRFTWPDFDRVEQIEFTEKSLLKLIKDFSFVQKKLFRDSERIFL